jgi:hypothetical protein
MALIPTGAAAHGSGPLRAAATVAPAPVAQPPPPNPHIVIFDYPHWMAAYPEFAAVTQPRAQGFFDQACVFCDNTACSPVPYNPGPRAIYLDMLTAHIAALSGGLDPCGVVAGGSGAGVVGRITSASEGSVSVSVGDMGQGDGPNAAWYYQTRYGAMYWTATAQYRTWQYFLGPQPFQETYIPYGRAMPGWRPY